LQKAAAQITNVKSIGVEKDFFGKIFEENYTFLQEETKKKLSSQLDINLIFTKDFMKMIQPHPFPKANFLNYILF